MPQATKQTVSTNVQDTEKKSEHLGHQAKKLTKFSKTDYSFLVSKLPLNVRRYGWQCLEEGIAHKNIHMPNSLSPNQA